MTGRHMKYPVLVHTYFVPYHRTGREGFGLEYYFAIYFNSDLFFLTLLACGFYTFESIISDL